MESNHHNNRYHHNLQARDRGTVREDACAVVHSEAAHGVVDDRCHLGHVEPVVDSKRCVVEEAFAEPAGTRRREIRAAPRGI